MRLIDRIRTEDFLRHSSKNESLIDWYLDRLDDCDLPIVDISNVANYVAVDVDRLNRPVREVIACALPPFHQCWMEYSLTVPSKWPETLRSVGALMSVQDMRDCALTEKIEAMDKIRVPKDRRENLDKVAWIVRGEFSSDVDGTIFCLHSYAYFLLDQDGMVLTPMLGGHFVDDDAVAIEDGHNTLCRVAIETMAIFAMGASFMSCKNVQLIEHQPSRHERRQRARTNKPSFTEYYTLEIEPMKKILRTEGKSEEVGLKKALHICRGHFAHYTPDKPLFGKVSGRFWIPAHVRGSKEVGEIKKDYRIKMEKGKKIGAIDS